MYLQHFSNSMVDILDGVVKVDKPSITAYINVLKQKTYGMDLAIVIVFTLLLIEIVS